MAMITLVSLKEQVRGETQQYLDLHAIVVLNI